MSINFHCIIISWTQSNDGMLQFSECFIMDYIFVWLVIMFFCYLDNYTVNGFHNNITFHRIFSRTFPPQRIRIFASWGNRIRVIFVKQNHTAVITFQDSSWKKIVQLVRILLFFLNKIIHFLKKNKFKYVIV